MKPRNHARPSGFTLMEMVVAILVLSIASATVIVLYSNLFTRNSNTENIQEGALLVQSCLENIAGMRQQSSNFFSIPAGAYHGCDYLPTLHGSGASLSVTVSTPTSATPPCPGTPSPVSCIQFAIHARNSGMQTSPDSTVFFIKY